MTDIGIGIVSLGKRKYVFTSSPRVHKYVTQIAIETHNSNREQDGIHREEAICQHSVDMLLLSKTIVPLYSLQLSLSYSQNKVVVTKALVHRKA